MPGGPRRIVADGPWTPAGPLRTLTRVDIEGARETVAGVELVAASDVDNPLLGMRGATGSSLRRRGDPGAGGNPGGGPGELPAELVGRAPNGKDPALAAGAGAAGGLATRLAQLGALAGRRDHHRRRDRGLPT